MSVYVCVCVCVCVCCAVQSSPVIAGSPDTDGAQQYHIPKALFREGELEEIIDRHRENPPTTHINLPSTFTTHCLYVSASYLELHTNTQFPFLFQPPLSPPFSLARSLFLSLSLSLSPPLLLWGERGGVGGQAGLRRRRLGDFRVSGVR